MYEVELKVRAAHEAVREALSSLDAERRGVVRQEDTYYDAPHRSFAATDEALRLRSAVRTDEDGAHTVTTLTYKGPLVERDSKTREERETDVEDAESTAAVFEALGFAPAAEVTKERERFDCGGYTVALDSVCGLGEFVEVERTVEHEADIERIREGARELLVDLGCDPDDQIRTSYLSLLLPDE